MAVDDDTTELLVAGSSTVASTSQMSAFTHCATCGVGCDHFSVCALTTGSAPKSQTLRVNSVLDCGADTVHRISVNSLRVCIGYVIVH